MKQTWILVGDGSHARLFQASEPLEPWQILRKLEREHSREKTDGAQSHEDRGEHGFARQLVGELEAGRQSGTFAELVLVAPPKFLGQLRAELEPSLKACVVKSLDKDYTHMAPDELQKHVQLA
ncbi:MAG TPA: host attachment protein [Polyangiaceae bacterium]|nr:host attachment protein [Polyangiaceae bacterium]